MTKPRVLMVLTRPYTNNPTSGREKINLFAHEAATQIATVQVEQFHHLLSTKSPWAIIKAAIRFLLGFLTNPYSLQALLFSDSQEILRIGNIVNSFKPDVVFIESERSIFLIQALRQRWPDLRIICDIDDLMSRRMTEWGNHGNAISLGYIERHLPALAKNLLAGPLASWICRHEATTLQKVEQQLLAIADRVILLSSKEAALLKEITPVELHSKIALIPPSCEAKQINPPTQPIRFIFIGSDALLQNRLTIEYLIDLWQEHNLQAPLAIYGKMRRDYPNLPKSIKFAGFASSLNDVYTANSVMLAPSFVKGGVKTKVLEAMEHGTLVVGNDITFEGIVDPDIHLKIPNKHELFEILQNPNAHIGIVFDNGQAIANSVATRFAPVIIAKMWQDCLFG